MTEPHGRVATTGFDVASVSVSVSVTEPHGRVATTGFDVASVSVSVSVTEPHGRVATTGFDVASVSVSVSVYQPYVGVATTGRLVLRTLRDVYYELHHRNLRGRVQYTCTDHSFLRLNNYKVL